MKPRGLLMKEHRLIEKMLAILTKEIKAIEQQGKADTSFIDTAVDFIRTYADNTHHGKEEDILFHELANKQLSDGDAKIMSELIEEHKYGRKKVKELVEAKENYIRGDKQAVKLIIDALKSLVEFYPKHIKKEDDTFFPNSEQYFSPEENRAMLDKFQKFDRDMIHKKYKLVIEQLAARTLP